MRLLDDGVRVHNTWGIDTKSASTLSHAMAASLHAARHRPDVVLTMNVATGFALPTLRARSVPVVMNVDGIEWERAKWGKGARTAFRAGAWISAQLATVLVADSREIARIWEERFGVRPEFIPYGAPVVRGLGSDAIKGLGLAPGGYALAVARLAPENNIELFLDAMEGQDWRSPVVIVGSANYSNPVEARLRDLQRKGRLLWLGHVSDQRLLSQLWANAGAYFHGHSVGGTNPALLQALGLGAPVVAVDTIFNREVLGNEGLLVDPVPGAVGAAIASLLTDPARRAAAAEQGRRIVAMRYRWEDVCLAYEQVMLRSTHQRTGLTGAAVDPAMNAQAHPE
jgi:glycosyltransferase involved in cell wall biosynthesis